jgi:hypothetical protein
VERIGDVIPVVLGGIKPIETEYKGILFRSRLEARWAVFMDFLLVRWYYEHEGFELSDGSKYLPDFFLPDVGAYIEVKPQRDDYCWSLDVAAQKCAEVAAGTHCRVFLACGMPPVHMLREDVDNMLAYFPDSLETGTFDLSYQFCHCPKCGRVGVEFRGRGERVCRDYSTWSTRWTEPRAPGGCGAVSRCFNGDDKRYSVALGLAEAHRFW